MTERPILFSAAMVRAILAGKKRQTRRVIKPQPPCQPEVGMYAPIGIDRHGEMYPKPEIFGAWCDDWGAKCPYGQPGDRLWCTMAAPSWKGRTFEQRFWDRVVKTDGCWEWLGVTNRKKYGQIKIGQHTKSTHRVSWELHHGAIRDGLHVLHRCNKPWCVNPAHLYVGTNADNIADKVETNRVARMGGSSNGRSKLTDAQVAEIKARALLDHARQADLAEEFGVSQGQISKILSSSRWESGIAGVPEHPAGLRTLVIKGVRVERVQDISDADIVAEGVPDVVDKDGEPFAINARPGFIALWDSINGKTYPFSSNPRVWVLEFEVQA